MWPQRILLAVVEAFFGGTALVGIGEWIHPLTANAQTTQRGVMNDHPQVVISGGDNVVSFGQIGGITARVVTINPPTNPELRILGRTETDNPDGSRMVTIKTEIASPITPGLMVVQIGAQGLKDVRIMPPIVGGGSTMILRNVRRGNDSYSAEIPSPRGQYDIFVQTMRPTEIHLNATF